MTTMKVNHKVPAKERGKRIRRAKGLPVEEQLDAIWEILADLVDGKKVSRRGTIDQMRSVKRRIEDADVSDKEGR